ncbi:hypothetical protein P153DRAFT_369613 [Dothidotthia symphoricarpi CBS 119687]|uniref:Uncharacterized protein n=1 Tax=Dothidotthia symphoricarpi CBS 119687 TaxID=1392245 RepID=A0A6A6A5T5_9PLEO|nr:uncharacterized protein P153DRAFT_369613 [Dothidotthia symphoricarpi CBS 119687]KAF2126277.1 hypothetical protein P153DRAFT_369613 [Dothidotthia symphoricarpi CBS 119687]
MQDTHQPPSFSQLPAQVSDITTLADRFTSQPGMNVPSTTPPGVTRPAAPTEWWASELTRGAVVPTEYLAQLPVHWPYTRFGAARRPRVVATWAFTHPNVTGQTVALLYHSMLWNPRPLYTSSGHGSSGNASARNPLLEGWTHAFVTTSMDNFPLKELVVSSTAMVAMRSADSHSLIPIEIMAVEPSQTDEAVLGVAEAKGQTKTTSRFAVPEVTTES